MDIEIGFVKKEKNRKMDYKGMGLQLGLTTMDFCETKERMGLTI